MGLSLQQFLSVLVILAVVLLATWCLGVIAWQFCRWLPTVALWRLRRVTIMVLMVVAAVAAIMAQKDRGSGFPPGMAPQTGTTRRSFIPEHHD